MTPLIGDCVEQRWRISHRADPAATRLADHHYNRQKIGSPQFAPPGSCAVFLTDCGRAFWVTSAPLAEWVKHAWAGAWVCSAFRSEGAGRASELIRQAVAATRAHYGDPPSLGMVTFIDTRCRKCNKRHPTCVCPAPDWIVRPTMVHGRPTWGWTYYSAGFLYAGETKGGLLTMQLLPGDMPAPLPAGARTLHGSPLFDAAMRNRPLKAIDISAPMSDIGRANARTANAHVDPGHQ
jgi:hypothetical protein